MALAWSSAQPAAEQASIASTSKRERNGTLAIITLLSLRTIYPALSRGLCQACGNITRNVVPRPGVD